MTAAALPVVVGAAWGMQLGGLSVALGSGLSLLAGSTASDDERPEGRS